jgi:hypothetical protein
MSNAVPALVLGTLLWTAAAVIAHPRELWDVGAFWLVWLAAILVAGALGLTRASRPFLDSTLLFLPILGVLTVQTLLNGGSASLLPLGLVAVLFLSLPAWVMARIAYWLTTGRWR